MRQREIIQQWVNNLTSYQQPFTAMNVVVRTGIAYRKVNTYLAELEMDGVLWREVGGPHHRDYFWCTNYKAEPDDDYDQFLALTDLDKSVPR
jgi:hypothetical protein